MNQTVIALLGRKDTPTDAVEEYCRYLATALQSRDIQLEIRRVPWEIHGWTDSLEALRLMATQWRGTWVLVQYTALAWSARGFPQKVLRAMNILKSAGARVGIVFHDVEPFPGARLIDSLRRFFQVRAMRRALALADLAVFTAPLYKLSWLPFRPGPNIYTDPTEPPPAELSPEILDHLKKVRSSRASALVSEYLDRRNAPVDLSSLGGRCHFIPVGANLPVPFELEPPPPSPRLTFQSTADHALTVGIFSITGGEAGSRETHVILRAMRHASEKLGRLRLSVFGRHAEIREQALKEGLSDLPVELSVEGVLDPHQLVGRLRACDVLLFVRGGISTRRSSAIAGIACGVPMVAYVGQETTWPLLDAGVILVSPSDPQELDDELIRLLSDGELRVGLALANHTAYNEHFSWAVIARRFAALLQPQKTL